MGKLPAHRNMDGVGVCVPQYKHANRYLDVRFNRLVCDFNEVVRWWFLGVVNVGGCNLKHFGAVVFWSRHRHDTYPLRTFTPAALYGNQFGRCLYNHSCLNLAYSPKVVR